MCAESELKFYFFGMLTGIGLSVVLAVAWYLLSMACDAWEAGQAAKKAEADAKLSETRRWWKYSRLLRGRQ